MGRIRCATGSGRWAPTRRICVSRFFGFAAFLLPVAIGILGYRWFRSRAVDSQWATLVGYGLLLLSLPSLLSLVHFPDVRGAIPAGGLLGGVVSHGLQSGFNFWGAILVAIALLIVALFLTTSFSFSGAHAWASGRKGHRRNGESWGFCNGRGRAGKNGGMSEKGADAPRGGGAENCRKETCKPADRGQAKRRRGDAKDDSPGGDGRHL